MTRELINIPSISSTQAQYDLSNKPVIDLLASWLDDLGMTVSVFHISKQKYNLVAQTGQGKGGLVLSGHTDTVPVDTAAWDTDPFVLTDKDNRLYGLGCCDMKTFFALVIESMKRYLDVPLKHPLTIVATADEESTMNGARALTRAQLPDPRFVIIGEPTDLIPVHQHKGIMMLKVRLEGSSGHSSNPSLGNNAMEALPAIINTLSAYRAELQKQHHDRAFEVAYPTLNLGCIHGGDNPNRICQHVELEFDIRVLPGMQNQKVLSELTTMLTPIWCERGLSGSLTLLHPACDPYELSSESPLHADLSEFSSRTGGAVAFATEAPFYRKLGVEAMVLGPGSINQAHQPNEYVEQKQLLPTIDIIGAAIERYCCQ